MPIPQRRTLAIDDIICHFMTLFTIMSGINVHWITEFSVIGLRHYFCDTMENTLLKYPHVPLNKKWLTVTETRWFPTISASLWKLLPFKEKKIYLCLNSISWGIKFLMRADDGSTNKQFRSTHPKAEHLGRHILAIVLQKYFLQYCEVQLLPLST